MTEINPPAYEQNACLTAQSDRQVLQSIAGCEGVAFGVGNNLAVVDIASGGLTVQVQSGNAFVKADLGGTWQGMYHVSNDGNVTLTVPAPDPSLTTTYYVYAHVYDSAFSGVSNNWALEVSAGSTSGSPTLPSSALLLATLVLPGGTTEITQAMITDNRVQYCGPGGSTTQPTIVTYTASGTFQKANYPSAKGFKIRLVGGGGGGGGTAATGASENAAAGGGGGAGYAEGILLPSALAASETVTVGGAGAAAAAGANQGGQGGQSAFGTFMTANGGTGGQGGTNTSSGVITATSGGGATATGGAINIGGQDGGYGLVVGGSRILTGTGGSSQLGLGGTPTNASNGRAGSGYGSGASGATAGAGSAARAGAAGLPGIVIVEVLY